MATSATVTVGAPVIVQTSGPGFTEITDEVAARVAEAGLQDGLAMLFIRHSSASLLIQENADPDVLADLQAFFARLAPHAPGAYAHATEGPDDMPAHIRSALTQTSLSVPIRDRRLALGTWQGIYLFEHRDRPHRRDVLVTLLGSPA